MLRVQKSLWVYVSQMIYMAKLLWFTYIVFLHIQMWVLSATCIITWCLPSFPLPNNIVLTFVVCLSFHSIGIESSTRNAANQRNKRQRISTTLPIINCESYVISVRPSTVTIIIIFLRVYMFSVHDFLYLVGYSCFS